MKRKGTICFPCPRPKGQEKAGSKEDSSHRLGKVFSTAKPVKLWNRLGEPCGVSLAGSTGDVTLEWTDTHKVPSTSVSCGSCQEEEML